jgi:hypothetical protein
MLKADLKLCESIMKERKKQWRKDELLKTATGIRMFTDEYRGSLMVINYIKDVLRRSNG